MRKLYVTLALVVGAVAPVAAGDPEVKVPGGPLSGEPRDCGPAKDHCMRGEAWFGTGFMDEHESTGMRPVFPLDGKWYTWRGTLVHWGTAYRTKAATASTLMSGRQAIVFAPGKEAGAGKLPRTELEALTSRRWSVVIVEAVDGAAGTFTSDRGTYAVDTARIPSNPRGI